MIDKCASKRQKLAEVAATEAALHLRGDEQFGGPAIEKYLASLRNALATRPRTRHLAEPGMGFSWCGAFAYYCCRAAGFQFSGRPSLYLPGTFAAVFIWREWALLPENQFYLPATVTPQPGDLVIFDCLLEDVACDHIGVVTAVHGDRLTTAEGNVANQSGIFYHSLQERSDAQQINGFIRITRDEMEIEKVE